MSTDSTRENALEAALQALHEKDDKTDAEAPRRVLNALATSHVYVILDRPPPTDPNETFMAMPLHVSDGPNTEQHMLALFSRRSRAESFVDAQESDQWKYVFEVYAPQALLNAVQGAGIVLNPNQDMGFRTGPELTAALCRDIKAAMEKARSMQKEQSGSATS